MAISDLIGRIRDAQEERGHLIPQLMKSLVFHEMKDPIGPKKWLGPAKAVSMCPRAMVMAHRLGIKLADDIDPQGRWRMDRGTALHVMVQELWLGPMGFLLGGWKCPKCALVHGTDETGVVSFRSAVPMPGECERCGLKNGKWTRFHFVEPEFRDAACLVMGKSDGLLHMAPTPVEVLDVKTTDDLDKVYTRRDGTVVPPVREAPRETDVKQLQWYLDAAGLRSGRLLYMSPVASQIEKAMVEHQVPFDPAMMHAEKEKIRGLREALQEESRPIPPCPYGGAGPYGECACVEVAVFWARTRR